MSVEIAPDMIDAWVNRGVELAQLGKNEEAITLLRQVWYVAPTHEPCRQILCQLLLQQGIGLLQLGEIERAITVFREGGRLQHDHPGLRRALGVTLLNQGMRQFQNGALEAAENLLREAEFLLLEDPAPRQLLLQLLVKKALNFVQAERTGEAVGVLREAACLAPNDPGVLFMLSRLAFESGMTEEAVAIARRLLVLTPQDANYAGWACIVLHALGDAAGAAAQALYFIELIKAGRPVADVNPGEILRILGEILVTGGEYQRAITMFVELAQIGFNQTICATVAADALLASGAVENALFTISPFAASTWSRTFVTASLAQFRDTLRCHGGEIAPRRIGGYDPASAIAMSSLASYGRFGQQMGEYLLGYRYACKTGLTLETPEWVGHYFFELDDPLMLPYRHIIRKGQGNLLRQGLSSGRAIAVTGADCWSPGGLWEQWSPGAAMLSIEEREWVQSRLQIRQIWMPYLQPAVGKLNETGHTIVALHLRRGDRVAMNDITQTSLYLDWLAQTWPTLDKPVLFLASDDIDAVKDDFSQYHPCSLADLADPWKNNEYLQDFFILMNCDILGISTGGFAASASLLNKRARLFVSPSSDKRSITPFTPYVTMSH